MDLTRCKASLIKIYPQQRLPCCIVFLQKLLRKKASTLAATIWEEMSINAIAIGCRMLEKGLHSVFRLKRSSKNLRQSPSRDPTLRTLRISQLR